MQFHTVEPGFPGAPGPRRKGPYDPVDAGLVHGLRHHAPGLDGRGGDPVGTVRVTPRVVDLQHCWDTVPLDGAREPGQPRDEAVLGDEQRPGVPETANLDGHVLHDHQARTRGGHFVVVVEHEVVHLVVLTGIGEVQGQADDPVGHLDAAET